MADDYAYASPDQEAAHPSSDTDALNRAVKAYSDQLQPDRDVTPQPMDSRTMNPASSTSDTPSSGWMPKPIPNSTNNVKPRKRWET